MKMKLNECGKVLDMLTEQKQLPAAAAAHLEICKECQKNQKTLQELRQKPSPTALIIPSAAFLNRIQSKITSPQPSVTSFLIKPLIIVVTAVSVLAIAFYYYVARPATQPVPKMTTTTIESVVEPCDLADIDADIENSLIEKESPKSEVLYFPSPKNDIE